VNEAEAERAKQEEKESYLAKVSNGPDFRVSLVNSRGGGAKRVEKEAMNPEIKSI